MSEGANVGDGRRGWRQECDECGGGRKGDLARNRMFMNRRGIGMPTEDESEVRRHAE
jgi:hypothetical protein